MIKQLLAAATALATLAPAQAVVTFTSPGFAYGQSFDGLVASGSGNPWTNDATLPGWYLFISNGAAAPSYNADNGGSNAGAFRSFGATDSAERALGGVASGGTYWGSPGPASGALAGHFAVGFSYAGSTPLAGFTIGFNGEQWRNGGNTAAQSMVLEYGFGATFAGVSNWTAPGGSFDWASPVVGNVAAAVDGNTAGRVGARGGSVATPWEPGQTLWIRWIERNDVGNDHGLAIDDFSFAVTPVPEPGMGTMLLAGLAAVGLLARRRAVPAKGQA